MGGIKGGYRQTEAARQQGAFAAAGLGPCFRGKNVLVVTILLWNAGIWVFRKAIPGSRPKC